MIRFPSGAELRSRRLWWHAAWLAVALVYAVPLTRVAYERLNEVTHRARERLIIEYRLWELIPSIAAHRRHGRGSLPGS